MKKLIIHCGMHKCGSTFIQNTLAANRDKLNSSGVLYLKTGRVTGSDRYGTRHLPLRNSLLVEGQRSMAASMAAEELQASTCEYGIVSYEGIFGSVMPETLMSAFSDFDIRIVIYTRNPVDYMESKYRQWVRMKYGGEIGKFVEDSYPYLNISLLMDKWVSIFGPKRVIFRPLEEIGRSSNLAVDLLSQCNEDFYKMDLQPTKQKNDPLRDEHYLAHLINNKMRFVDPLLPKLKGGFAPDFSLPGGRLLSDDQMHSLDNGLGKEYRNLLGTSKPAAATSLRYQSEFFSEEIRLKAAEFVKLHCANVAAKDAKTNDIERARAKIHELRVEANKTKKTLQRVRAEADSSLIRIIFRRLRRNLRSLIYNGITKSQMFK